MNDVFKFTTRPKPDLFFGKGDPHDRRLGEIVASEIEDYDAAEIVILGCPQDEGVRRNNGRVGAAKAPDAIRRQFYKLTPFEISAAVFDAGDTIIGQTLEETHHTHQTIVERLLLDGKKIIVLGGGNDVSFPDGGALATFGGTENWLALNIDAHFDVRADSPRNSGTAYRQLLDGQLLKPENFFEIAYQKPLASPVYFEYLRKLHVNLISLEEFQDLTERLTNQLSEKIAGLSAESGVFWGFDVDAVRAADAPGVSAPSPIGLTAQEFCFLAELAGRTAQTKIVEFTEMNPEFDSDGQTAKLVALAMHGFLRAVK